MSSKGLIYVRDNKERQEMKLVMASKGFDVAMETENHTVMSREKRRSWIWLLLFWPMLLIKKTERVTIEIVSE